MYISKKFVIILKENINLALNAAKTIGGALVNITAGLIIEKKEHIILGFIWQVSNINSS